MTSLSEWTRERTDLVPPDADWASYVHGSRDADLRPTGVRTVEGDIGGIEDFLSGRGPLTLRGRADGSLPSVVLDYGRNVAGIPWLDVAATADAPQVRISYSESAEWIGPDGDVKGGHNDSADRSRVHQFVGREGRMSSGLIQGGQRYQRIALASPGTLVIDAVGLRSTAFRAGPEDYAGWFLSSSRELNQIWYDGAYTTQINQLPADTLPVAWSIREGALDAKGGTLGVLRDGSQWTDLIVEFEACLIERAIGWVVRAERDGASGCLLTLRAGGGGLARLEVSVFDDGHEGRPQDTVRRYRTVAVVDTPDLALETRSWFRVRTSVSGTTLAVDVNGQPLGAFDLGDDLPESGAFGFHQVWGTSKALVEHARFRNLRVFDPQGATLYADGLNSDPALASFVGDAVSSPDPLPVILDGGRRDRSVWSGDLIVQIPNLFYTTAAAEYSRGSIELLAGYQEPSGQSASRIPPILPVAIPPQHGQTYSAAYSMHHISNVGLHHLFTGDAEFVRAQWPGIRRQLEFDRSLMDDRGLVLTDASNGLDWDWYDGPKLGAVTAYNIACYQSLVHAARMAQAIDERVEAALLTERARALRQAVNTHLYDGVRHVYVMSDRRHDVVAQDANALAIASGIAPDGEHVAILDALESALPHTDFGYSPFNTDAGFREDISPYVSGSHVTALFEAGLTDRAFTLVSELWGHMAFDPVHAVGTAWELVGIDGSPGFGATTSLAHGWACGASTALSAYVLGVRPVTAGYSQWSIAPQPGSLMWAKGRVPTPHGPIDVSWRRAGDQFAIDVDVPQLTSGTIILPRCPQGQVRIEGTARARASVGSHTVTIEVRAGGAFSVVAL